ncbi:SidA/IucD/PvdA family monooxygenase [Paenalkalicoccus suaedae]|uniref:L-lysine N6-monooxygenase MbtG n=1 Tax=Paenalkalicoccus suaedae TaxID=2592382 RepID=A0A859FDA6_9BACI|nr:SidA/IucD/PvdA family monooxygenase [Paenalkalicoccus suaedae]QKS70564.1 SidA/IucD/PvdA family monooxygenase [Paenalkalicoccus suaedae]
MDNLYDIIGIGIGPSNLGMAALLEDQEDVKALFFDESPTFQWHPGMLIEGADLQVPFLADLVTFADPTSRFTFLNYIHEKGRMFSFFFFNRFDIPRREYNDYAKWVADKLSSLQFGRKVTDLIDHKDHYEIKVEDSETQMTSHYFAKHIVVGTGTTPMIPKDLEGFPEEDVLHTSQYHFHEKTLMEADRILVVGSGQSAAEVFLERLQQQGHTTNLYWLTRSSGFFQLEAGKLGQEVFSPDYIDYFQALPFKKRVEELPNLSQLRNGVEQATLHQIYDLLYHRSVAGEPTNSTLQTNSEITSLKKVDEGYVATCYQSQLEQSFELKVDKVILGTGYKPNIPAFLKDFYDKVEFEDEDRFKVTRDYKLVFKDSRKHQIYSLTNLEHSHGAGATNLALSVHRNIVIINEIAGRELYKDVRDNVFQSFHIEQENGQ